MGDMFPVMFGVWVADVIPGCNVNEILSLQGISDTTPFKTNCKRSVEHVHLDICPGKWIISKQINGVSQCFDMSLCKTEKLFLLVTHA